MPNRFYGHMEPWPKPEPPASVSEPKPTSAAGPEPAVRRWPHPVPQPPAAPEGPTLQYIRCVLSYQNELLCEIKTLLEQLAVELADGKD